MGIELTPSFLMEYERDMRAITENEYARRLAGENTWWNKLLRTKNIERKSERVTWLLSTAFIEPIGPTNSGQLAFEDLVTQTVEYPVMRHGKGIKVHRDQIEDLDGTGLNALAEWSSQIGSDMAYYPQRMASQLILNGAATDGTANAYDGVPFFADQSNAHPVNPYKLSSGSYANWLHGAAGTGGYPGAMDISDAVTTDTALINLGKVIAYIASLKMPNGIDPRFLTPKLIVAPPRMAPRVRELTKAKYIAQAAASGGGSGDIEALVRGWALGEPVTAQEFAASTTYNFKMAVADPVTGHLSVKDASASGNDTTWYLFCQENQSTQLGGLLHVNRKPFKVTYYSGDSGGGISVDLDRANELEYHCQGRMSVQYGHPYTVFRIDAS